MCRGLPLEGLPQLAAPKASKQQPHRGSQPQQYDDEFLVYTYKVVPCDKTWRHDYNSCPFAHAGESSERRHPSSYLPFMCGSTQHSTDLKEKCPFGTSCKYAHGHFELWLHPGRFRTKMCSLGNNCRRPVCFFAHSEQQLRVTPYSKFDTAAAVAAQQIAVVEGADASSPCTSVVNGSRGSSVRSASSDGGDTKAVLTGLDSPCGSSANLHTKHSSPAGSVTGADELAALTAGRMLNTQTAMLDMQLHNNSTALLAAADPTAASASGSWLGMSSAMLSQQQMPLASMTCSGSMLPQQGQLVYLDAAANTMGFASTAAAGNTDLMNSWMLQSNAAVAPAAALSNQWAVGTMLQHTAAYGSCSPALQVQGLPVPGMLGSSTILDQWLQLENPSSCGAPPGLTRQAMGGSINAVVQQQPAVASARMAQLLSTLPDPMMQQLLELLTVEGQGM